MNGFSKIALAGMCCMMTAALASAEESISIKPYGYIKLDAMYDTHRVAPGDLMFYVLPHRHGADDKEFRMTARETRLGLNIRGPQVGEVGTSGRVEADFYGRGGDDNTPVPRLRLAYIDIDMPGGFSVRAGQDWETFITVPPRTLNFANLADSGALGLRRPQLRATQQIPLAGQARLIAKVAAARTIGHDLTGYHNDAGVDSGLPTGQGNLILESPLWTERSARISISGHIGRETCDRVEDGEFIANDDKHYDSWSVIGSLYLPLHQALTLQGTIWQGENLATYFGGIGQGINKVQEKSIGARGGFAQLLIDVVPDKLNVNLGYGLDDPDNDDLNANDRSRNRIAFGSIFYKLTRDTTLAFEYSNMKTSYKDADSAQNNRFQGAAIYRF